MMQVYFLRRLVLLLGLALMVVLALGELKPAQAQGRWPWTSQRPVTEADTGPLTFQELEIMRNEIYARHGWVFARKDLRAYFESQPWYQPRGATWEREYVNRAVEAELTPMERENINRIVRYERAKKQGAP
jgi:hypothetical protein